MSDLDLGMNNWMADPFKYPEKPISRGKVLSKADLDRLGGFARYKDVDGDGIGYRTLPGTDHPAAAYFARGSGHNEKAQYSERPDDFERNMERLNRKFETARSFVPRPEVDYRQIKDRHHRIRHLALGTDRSPRPVAPGVQHRDRLSPPARLSVHPRSARFREAARPWSTWSNRIATPRCSPCSRWISKPALHTRLRSIAHIHGLPLDARSVTDELMTMEGK